VIADGLNRAIHGQFRSSGVPDRGPQPTSVGERVSTNLSLSAAAPKSAANQWPDDSSSACCGG
jgi:hypothetical protein